MNNSSQQNVLIVHRAPIEKLINYYKNHEPGTLPLPVADAIDSLMWCYAPYDPYNVIVQSERVRVAKNRVTLQEQEGINPQREGRNGG